MNEPAAQVYPDLEALSTAAAGVFAQTAEAAQSEGRDAWIAVSGGLTPRRLFECLSAPPRRDEVPWRHVQLCQVDERPVPPGHPDSNYRLLKETLLDRVDIPFGNVHRIRAEMGADQAASAYEAELRSILPAGANGMLRFDLVFLGMGDDGHTASLFPHSPGLHEMERWVIANTVEKLGMQRITLTYPVLNAAASVVFLVSGAGKAAVLDRVLRGARDVEELPAQGIRPVNGDVVWIVDSAAAGTLPDS